METQRQVLEMKNLEQKMMLRQRDLESQHQDRINVIEIRHNDEMRQQMEHYEHALDLERDFKAKRLEQAENLKRAFRHEDAALIYEEFSMWDEAGRARRLQLEESPIRPQYIAKEIDLSTNTQVQDSYVTRSLINGKKGPFHDDSDDMVGYR